MSIRSRLTDSVLDRPIAWSAVLLALTLAAGFFIPHLTLRTDGASLYPDDEPAVRHSEEDRRRFYEPQRVILLVEAKGTERLDTPNGLRRLTALHDEISRWPEIQGAWVRSVITLMRPPEGPDDPRVSAYLEEAVTDEEWRQAIQEARTDPLTEGLFLSDDGRAAAIYLPLADYESETLPDISSRTDLMASLEARLRAFDEPALDKPTLDVPVLDEPAVELQLTGPAVAEVRLGETVIADLAWLVPLLLVVVAALLAFTLRTMGGVLLPLIEVAVVLVWTFAAMSLAGVPLTLTTTILPVVLMAMAITDEIHLLEALERHLRTTQTESAPKIDREARKAALRSALDEVGRPIVLTSLTTAVGFLSFTSASIAPIRQFGLFAAFGLVAAMFLSFTLIPALAMLLPASWLKPPRRQGDGRWHGSAGWIVRHRTPIFLSLVAAVALLVLGIPRLSVQDSWMDNFDPEAPVVTAGRQFDTVFWGSYRYDVVLERNIAPDREGEYFFRTPEGVAIAEEVRAIAESAPEVSGSVSYLRSFEAIGPSRGIAPPLSNGDPETLKEIYAVAEAVARRIDLRYFLSPKADAMRAMVVVSDPDFRESQALDTYMRPRLDALAEDHDLRWHASGDLPLAVSGVEAIVGNQLRSIGWTLAIVLLLLAFALRSPRRALIALTPVAAAVAAVLGLMGWLGVPLGIATSMFAA